MSRGVLEWQKVTDWCHSPYHNDHECRTLYILLDFHTTSSIGAKFLFHQVLGGIADTVAQSLTAIRAKSKRNAALGKDISDGIEMPDYDEKSPYATEFLIPHRTPGPPPFDFERLTRFMSYGFIMSPVQFQWFAFLSRAFPFSKQSATLPALQRVCFDQLIFAPIGK